MSSNACRETLAKRFELQLSELQTERSMVRPAPETRSLATRSTSSRGLRAVRQPAPRRFALVVVGGLEHRLGERGLDAQHGGA